MQRQQPFLSKHDLSASHSHNSYYCCTFPYQHHLFVQNFWWTGSSAPQKLATYCICLHPISSPYWVVLYSYKLHKEQWTTAFSKVSTSAQSHHHAYSMYKRFSWQIWSLCEWTAQRCIWDCLLYNIHTSKEFKGVWAFHCISWLNQRTKSNLTATTLVCTLASRVDYVRVEIRFASVSTQEVGIISKFCRRQAAFTVLDTEWQDVFLLSRPLRNLDDQRFWRDIPTC